MMGKRQKEMMGKRQLEQPRVKAEKKEKREDIVDFSPLVREEAIQEQVSAAWKEKRAFNHDVIVMDTHPFLHCVIPNFIQSQTFLEGLEIELLNLNFQEKSNDLYKFKQSDDLKKRKEPHIHALRKVLFENFRTWLSNVTNVEFEQTIDMSCAMYNYTDILLCHDDELEGRRIAFILYLVPPWGKMDGGTLDLYSIDEHFQPREIVKSLVPSWNSLTFFEVSPVSFHQVSEVLSKEKCRLSVSGWFHGPSLERPARYIEPLLPRSPHIPHDHKILYEWINPMYLDMKLHVQVQEEFAERSEILLKDFLKLEKFKEVCEILKKENLEWKIRGPPNKRFYETAEGRLPDVLRDCMELFHSEAMFLLLSNLTGLKLHFLASDNDEEETAEIMDAERTSDCAIQSSTKLEQGKNKDKAYQLNQESAAKQKSKIKLSVPVCKGELRQWGHGNYTLMHDTDTDHAEFALDLLLFFGCEDWEAEYGGFTSYIAKEEDEELLTMIPENNALALIYRDKETLKFVKYINHRSLDEKKKKFCRTVFWDFSFVYYE
ncbi:LOW QUALITY PROTEIN: prolyl 3-hydroxylase OGFOD1 [Microcaecilia unicolor]|uniref:Prolyl 3-hydroxylase OGFOD1 n=1 Tax=Microcaecilia unicolor TaxID=1415580 RepID=A0A6P7Y3V7_9AMPH|nr:LOW QUALITY PROTEIN: prolyl 3-hydroxylase OGFOD1 [Microcaecilia unicolor]